MNECHDPRTGRFDFAPCGMNDFFPAPTSTSGPHGFEPAGTAARNAPVPANNVANAPDNLRQVQPDPNEIVNPSQLDLPDYEHPLRGGDLVNPNETIRNEMQTHGQLFVPAPLPSGVPRGIPHECYGNAARLLLDHPEWDYAQGWAWHADYPSHGAISHGWAVDKAGRVVDPTWDNPERHQYFGTRYNRLQYLSFLKSGGDGIGFTIVRGDRVRQMPNNSKSLAAWIKRQQADTRFGRRGFRGESGSYGGNHVVY